MIRISQLKLLHQHTQEELITKIEKTLRLPGGCLCQWEIRKRSLDARKKPDIYYVYTIDVFVKDENLLKKRLKGRKNVEFCREEKPYTCMASGTKILGSRPVVIGTGPAGLFAGYQLALLGYRPILLERGEDVETRTEDVRKFWAGGDLKESSNVQFGEGGAGTFSDGKLNTLVKDPAGRGREVLKTFVKFGAPKEILYDSKPHIGTDILAGVIKNMREAIICAGGEVRFHSCVTDFLTEERYTAKKPERRVTALLVEDTHTGETCRLEAEVVVAAIGHSARDTFQKLYEKGFPMEAKSFAVGVRIEHPQALVDAGQYGRIGAAGSQCGRPLPAAAYKLTARAKDGRGVYTFCMCPGGYVVDASSEEGRLAVNGMSYHDRAGANANSAVIVTVTPEDYGYEGALSGVEFQRRLEEAAYRQGRGQIPAQLFGDFCRNLPSAGPGEILPQMKGAYRWGNVREIFPETLAAALEQGIHSFGRKLDGYAREDAVLSGVESRTSSPVRLLRTEGLQSEVTGFYPCGEGAGYAGGIMSASMDGLKSAEAVARIYRPFDK